MNEEEIRIYTFVRVYMCLDLSTCSKSVFHLCAVQKIQQPLCCAVTFLSIFSILYWKFNIAQYLQLYQGNAF